MSILSKMEPEYKTLLNVLQAVANCVNEAELSQTIATTSDAKLSADLMQHVRKNSIWSSKKIRTILTSGELQSLGLFKSVDGEVVKEGMSSPIKVDTDNSLTCVKVKNNNNMDQNSSPPLTDSQSTTAEIMDMEPPVLEQIPKFPQPRKLKRPKVDDWNVTIIPSVARPKKRQHPDVNEDNEKLSKSPCLQDGQPRSAYKFFYLFCKEAVQKQYPGQKVDIDVVQLSRQCNERWKTMTEYEKRSFRTLAKREKEKFEAEKMKTIRVSQKQKKEEEIETTTIKESITTEDESETAKETDGNDARRYITYSQEELQSILDYVCKNKKHWETGPLKTWSEAKEAGHFYGRTAVALQQQFRKTIFPNLHSFTCTTEDRRLLRQAKNLNKRNRTSAEITTPKVMNKRTPAKTQLKEKDTVDDDTEL